MKLPSSIYVAAVLFFALTTGGSMFMSDGYSNHNVSDNTSVQVSQQYDNLQDDIRGNNSLRSKIETLGSSQGGILDAASAGILIVPQFLSVLIQPVGILANTIHNSAIEFAFFVPDWIVIFAELITVVGVSFAVLSLVLGRDA